MNVTSITRTRPLLSLVLRDPRWPALATALAQLRDQGRRSVRIVDIECDAGILLLQAVRHASALGFLAVEGRGVGVSTTLIGRACTAAARVTDRAIGIEFAVGEIAGALAAECEMPADIILWHGAGNRADRPSLLRALHHAGNVVIGDPRRAGQGRLAA